MASEIFAATKYLAAFFITMMIASAALVFLYDMPFGLWLDLFVIGLAAFGLLAWRRIEHVITAHKALAADITDPENYLDLQRPVVKKWQESTQKVSELETSLDVYRDELDDWIALWSHQIKLPLTALSLMTESEPAQKIQIHRIERYIEMMMAYSRLGGDIVLDNIDVEGLVRSVIRSFSTEFIHKKIRLETDLTKTEVMTDPKWLEFVIGQIVSNALKYTRSGGTVSITLRDCRLVISDTGIGISASDLPRITEKGYTGFNGHEQSESSGIGLYLCQQVLDMLHLKWTIESEVDVGTTVTILLSQKPLEHDSFVRYDVAT